jgi:membrane protein
MNRKNLVQLFRISFRDWQADNAPLRAAALTFFIILPLPSLLLILEPFFAQFYGQTQATQQVIQIITSLAGPAVAELFRELLSSSTSPFSSLWTAVTLVIFSLAGAIGTFSVLRDTMDVIWEVKLATKPKLITRIKQRIGPFVLVSALGIIVIAWTGIATSLFSAIRFYSINGTLTFTVVAIAQVLLSFGLSTLLFAIIFKVIPEVKVHWGDVILPSVVTSIAFTVANYILGWYIQIFTVTTIVGSAGSLLIILIWIFILNQIVLFGAEASKVYASTFGPHPKQHLPASVERIVKPLERAGERIEQATKGTDDEPTQKQVEEQPMVKPSKQKESERIEEKIAEPKEATNENKSQPRENQNQDEGMVEVSVKIKKPENKQKTGEV